MSILIISWDDHHRNPYNEWLQGLEDNVILICPQNKKKTFPNYFYKEIIGIDNWNKEELLQISKSLNVTYEFNLVIALDELDLEVAAIIRDELNIEGQRYENCINFRDKFVMKKTVQRMDLKHPKFAHCKNKYLIYNFLQVEGFPIVIKPLKGVGSVDTHIIRTKTDLDLWFREYEYRIEEFMMESFVKGNMYHIDGLILDSKLRFCWPSSYYNDGINQIKQNCVVTSSLLSSENLAIELENYTINFIKGFPMPTDTNFHLEVFVNENNEITFCEIACRAPGGRIEYYLEDIFGFNINEVLLRKVCKNDSIPFSYIGPSTHELEGIYGFLVIGPPKGKITNKPIIVKEPWILKLNYSGEINKNYLGSQYSSDSVAYLTCYGEGVSRMDLIKKMIDFKEKYHKLLLK
ncbi:hypothetical protein [Shouchella miscanthi]|uniref:ATP-grasp domain-containing protein n=1 Tax=Shouchella miscanthi TaxID=2598861 RepID=A0ABU6NH39_9BACI|nr:hypothetical protein [Shouchella miscanthi]